MRFYFCFKQTWIYPAWCWTPSISIHHFPEVLETYQVMLFSCGNGVFPGKKVTLEPTVSVFHISSNTGWRCRDTPPKCSLLCSYNLCNLFALCQDLFCKLLCIWEISAHMGRGVVSQISLRCIQAWTDIRPPVLTHRREFCMLWIKKMTVSYSCNICIIISILERKANLSQQWNFSLSM